MMLRRIAFAVALPVALLATVALATAASSISPKPGHGPDPPCRSASTSITA